MSNDQILSQTPDHDVESDPLWLEDIHGQQALKWVAEQNIRTTSKFGQSPIHADVEASVLRELTHDTRIPWVTKHGEFFYNLWQSEEHPKGIWRRTTLEEYRKPDTRWDAVLDIDELSRKESTEWIFAGASVPVFSDRQCLISLSAAGNDACVIREFDLVDKSFIKDGFTVPASRSHASWVDSETILIADAVNTNSTTASGYARIVKRWRRGTSLQDADIVFEGSITDTGVFTYRDQTSDTHRQIIVRSVDGNRRDVYLLSDFDQLKQLEIPEEADFTLLKDWLLIKPSNAWVVGATTHPAGTLLATNLERFTAGDQHMQVLFTPSTTTALLAFQGVGGYLVLKILDNVLDRLQVLRFNDDQWIHVDLEIPIPLSTASISRISPTGADYFLTLTGFLQPPTLYLGNLETGKTELLKQASTDLPLDNYRVEQHFATSSDGTRIPYFQISSANIELDGENPALLYGYGGFQVSLPPRYLGVEIPAWLELGGTCVVANIRGGGEYGPLWHQAALRDKRNRAFEDFAAVAKSLFERKVTRPALLGARGASNGGLLIGNMLTQYPELFGCLVCEAPLLDMKRYTKMLAGPSWVAEYGDPDIDDDWVFIKRFSPYHNLDADKSYPPTLFLTSISDDRVSPAHARKMTYRMHDAGYSQAFFLESLAGGHSGAASQKEAASRRAIISSFLWSNLFKSPEQSSRETS